VADNFSDIELFWDRITRERISEVGEDAPFDFLYRGELNDGKNAIRGLDLGGSEASVEVDMVNVDLESHRIRLYDMRLGSTRESFGPNLSDQNGSKISQILEGGDNHWGYDSSMLVFDGERSYERSEDDLIQGSVYWPESTRDHPEDVYRDIRRIFGQDIISQL
jgi:hypothetical protein